MQIKHLQAFEFSGTAALSGDPALKDNGPLFGGSQDQKQNLYLSLNQKNARKSPQPYQAKCRLSDQQ